MSNDIKNLSAEAEMLYNEMKNGLVLWFSDAGEYPDRFWLEGGEDQSNETGQQINNKLVTELQSQGLIEPDSGDSYRQSWRLAEQV